MKLYHISLVAMMLIGCSGSTDNNLDSSNDISTGTCPHNVTRHDPNGWLLSVPSVHMDFWGSWNQFDINTATANWSVLLNRSDILDRLAEYDIHTGTFDINYSVNTGSTTYADGGAPSDGGAPTVLDDNTFGPTLNGEILTGSLPYPTDNTLYVIMLPSNTTTQLMVQHHWIGYHTHYSFVGQRYAYAMVSGNDNVTVSHEIYEAATNPDGSSGWYGNGSEIGDFCEGDKRNIDGVIVQKVWSQDICQCL